MQANSPELKHNTIFSCELTPVTSLNTSRYDNPGCAQLCPWVVPRGPASTISMPLASKWRHVVHPEGKPYFALTGEYDFAVVTESNVEDTQTEGRVLDCAKAANKELQHRNIRVPSRCELFLELGRDNASCNYYFVDHMKRALFWLEDLGTESLGIPAPVSLSHLGMALERLYWAHVEFFPMHYDSCDQLFSQFVDDLYNIISHGLADRLTSRTSTFPYTEDLCKHFLKLLSRKRGQHVDGYTLCYAARLSGTIVNQRFITFYGQQSAQLDRLQQVFPADIPEHKWLSSMANLLMWGIPGQYANLLEDLYMNEEVYADQWTHFISLSLGDWTNSLTWSLPLLITSILLSVVQGGTISTSIPSVLFCAVSIASASCLHLRHRPLSESSATAHYLRSAKSDSLGFLPLSTVFSLPKAGNLWGTGFLIAQFIFIISHLSKLVALMSASCIAGMLIFTLWAIYPADTGIASFEFLPSFCRPHLHALDPGQDELMA